MKLTNIYHSIIFLFAIYSGLIPEVFAGCEAYCQCNDDKETCADFLTQCGSICTCGPGGCNMTSCNVECNCWGGNCNLDSCTSNCQCEGGNCDMPVCVNNCLCKGGGCTGPAFEKQTTSGTQEVKVGGLVSGLITALVVGLYSF